jgi:hypothetical protein
MENCLIYREDVSFQAAFKMSQNILCTRYIENNGLLLILNVQITDNLKSLCRPNTWLQGYCDSKLLSEFLEVLMNYRVYSVRE